MIGSSYDSAPITPAESTRHSWSEEENRLSREHDITVRRMELDVLKIENRWASWFKLPITVIKLPMYLLLAVGYIVAMARKHEPSKDFWELLR